jgi:hypothetical protein
MEMKLKSVYFCLLLVLASLWADRLGTDALLQVTVPARPPFGEEFYPLSIRNRAETLAKIEAPSFAQQAPSPFCSASIMPDLVGSGLHEETTICLFCGSRACYILMSLQR